jgi:hypothetical protein
MSALYAIHYQGGAAVGFGVVYIGKGKIVGVDINNVRINGTYVEERGRMKPNVILTAKDDAVLVTGDQMPAGTTIPLTADWPADFANGQALQIMVAGKPVQITFEKVGDIP